MIAKDWIAPARTALLLVDMQVDFAAPDGAMGKAGMDLSRAAAAIRHAEQLADAARAAGVPCLFVRLITRASDETDLLREWKQRRGSETDAPLCREGTRGAEFVAAQPRHGELVVSKYRYSIFHGTGLDAALKAKNIDTLVVSGLTTECCVQSSVWAAFERPLHVFIAADACAAYEDGLHRGALEAMALSGANLAAAADFIAAWKSQ